MESFGVEKPRSVSDTPHDFTYNLENKTRTWERLEQQRLQKLGLNNKYSRHFNVLRQSKNNIHGKGTGIACVVTPMDKKQSIVSKVEPRWLFVGMGLLGTTGTRSKGKGVFNMSNSIAPFATVGKATCGFFFTDQTDNKKHNFGIPASDLVKWRNFLPSSAN